MTPKELERRIKNYYSVEKELYELANMDVSDVESCYIYIQKSSSIQPRAYSITTEKLKLAAGLVIKQHEESLKEDKKLFESMGLKV